MGEKINTKKSSGFLLSFNEGTKLKKKKKEPVSRNFPLPKKGKKSEAEERPPKHKQAESQRCTNIVLIVHG